MEHTEIDHIVWDLISYHTPAYFTATALRYEDVTIRIDCKPNSSVEDVVSSAKKFIATVRSVFDPLHLCVCFVVLYKNNTYVVHCENELDKLLTMSAKKSDQKEQPQVNDGYRQSKYITEALEISYSITAQEFFDHVAYYKTLLSKERYTVIDFTVYTPYGKKTFQATSEAAVDSICAALKGLV